MRRSAAVHGDGQRHRHHPPRPVHQRVVPAAEREARPHLQQRHGRRVLRAPRRSTTRRRRRTSVRAARERHDAAELVPDARLGRPLDPRVPRIERPPRDFEREQREAQRQPREQPPTRRRARRRRVRAARHAARGRRELAATTRRPSRRHASAASASAAASSGSAIAATPKGTPASDSTRIHSVSSERADEPAGAGEPRDLARRGQRRACGRAARRSTAMPSIQGSSSAATTEPAGPCQRMHERARRRARPAWAVGGHRLAAVPAQLAARPRRTGRRAAGRRRRSRRAAAVDAAGSVFRVGLEVDVVRIEVIRAAVAEVVRVGDDEDARRRRRQLGARPSR